LAAVGPLILLCLLQECCMDLAFVSAPSARAVRAVIAWEAGALSPSAESLGGVREAMARAPRFTGGKGQVLDLIAGAGEGRVIVIGAGAEGGFGVPEAEAAGGHAWNAAKGTGAETLALDLRGLAPERGERRLRRRARQLSVRSIPHPREAREEAVRHPR
jgi:leucyl aminopeptidase